MVTVIVGDNLAKGITQAERNLLKFVFHQGHAPTGWFAKLLSGDKQIRKRMPAMAQRLDMLELRAELSDELNAKVEDDELLVLLEEARK